MGFVTEADVVALEAGVCALVLFLGVVSIAIQRLRERHRRTTR